MPRIYVFPTHQSPGWLIPTICIVYGALVIFTAFVAIKNISLLRENTLHKLPATFNDNTMLRRTLTALLIIVASLLWPVILAISIPSIAIIWIAAEIQEFRESRIARRQREQDADLERGAVNPHDGEHQQNVTVEDRQIGEPSTLNPALAQVTEPPPAYSPYPSVLATLQTQWIQTSDRSAERYIFMLNNNRRPEEMLRSASRVAMIPSRR